jgi:pimeloyl-ACP methyl ester carboxylesterase
MSASQRRRRRLLRWGIGIGISVLLTAALLSVGLNAWLDRGSAQVEKRQKRVTSKDGTSIAYEESGSGPALIIVAAALADRDGTTRLANHLARHFTIVNYDRRGRGQSSDTQPYSVEREVEDIEALIDAAGGSAFVFGSSSGSVLALDAASRLGAKVKKLFMYEPPFIVDTTHPPLSADFSRQIGDLVTAGHRNDAVKLFFARGMGIPSFAVTLMRWFMPGWSEMAAIAHTLPYDLAVLDGTQAGKPLPVTRWRENAAPTLIAVGSKSEPFFHTGAQALVPLLPRAEYQSLEGLDHSAILMATKALADEIGPFFLKEQ